jgi:D-alanyl-D-alanine carboxypeptidase
MLTRFRFVLAVIIAFASGFAGGRAALAAEQPFPEAERAALTATIEAAMKDKRLPGLNVGIWIPGRGNFVQSFGTGDLATGTPMDLADHVRIASITKTFTATAILELVDQGKLSLDDTLSQFIEGIPNGERITIRNLLGMTSGIYDFLSDEQFMAALKPTAMTLITAEQAIAILRDHGPDFAPGEAVVYCDINYILLGVILETVSGRKAADVITEDLIEPLGLAGTRFPDTPEMPSPYAHGYYGGDNGTDPLQDVTRSQPNWPWTAGAMISTLEDLRVWAKVLATGTELSPATQKERLTFRPFTSGNEGASYGLGILNYGGFLGHYGMIFGYTTAVFYLPDADATFVISGNQSTNFSMAATEIFLALARHLYPERFE